MLNDYDTLKTIVADHHRDLARSARSVRLARIARRSASAGGERRRWWR
jgi:hypothetical protein